MKKLLSILGVSAMVTVLFLGFAHFFPLRSIGNGPQDCCDQFVYTNRHGFILILREDKSGGFAGLPPANQYHVGNYIKLSAAAFAGATLVQLARLHKRADAPRR